MSEPTRAAPTISVIMPVYNGAQVLPRSLPPLAAMLREGEIAEIIVVDDGSTDASAALAREHGVRLLDSGGRLGPGGARNVAAPRARELGSLSRPSSTMSDPHREEVLRCGRPSCGRMP